VDVRSNLVMVVVFVPFQTVAPLAAGENVLARAAENLVSAAAPGSPAIPGNPKPYGRTA